MKSTFTARLLGRLHLCRSAWAIFVARRTGVEVSDHCEFGAACSVRLGFAQPHRGTITIGTGAVLGQGVVLHPWGGSIRIGDYAHVGPGCIVYGHGGVEIGADSLIGPYCRIFSSEHAVPPLGTPIRSQPDIRRRTQIGQDVWLGASVTVLAGVTIGDGCVVGANALVTKDLPAGSCCVGSPATIRRWRDGAASI